MIVPLLWAGLRFGPRGAAAASLLLAVLIAFFTTQYFTGLTPDQVSSGEYVFVMQMSLAVAALVALIPAIVIGERDRKMLELRDSEERLRELSRRLIEIEESERRNINRELHDRVGQNLSALNLNLEIIRGQLSLDALHAVGPRLDDMQRLLGMTSGQVRDVMAELRPAALDDYGLLAALRTYAEPFSQRIGIPVDVQGVELSPRLPPAMETALFRIVQEALSNVAKHAQARKVKVVLAVTPQRVKLTVADDGVGFDAGRPSQDTPTYGIVTMRERAEAAGARLQIESAPGKGTRVEVEIAKAFP
jgi:signal transduction histidine kinase